METNKDLIRTLIVVRGGVVQSVYASNNIIVEVRDYDNIEIKNKELEKKEFEDKIKDLIPIL